LEFKESYISVGLISKLQQLAFERAERVIRVGWERTEGAAARAVECRATLLGSSAMVPSSPSTATSPMEGLEAKFPFGTRVSTSAQQRKRVFVAGK
ncbi:hypothetical protein GOODEAATRI_008703, partial [Goodea atripinnis]